MITKILIFHNINEKKKNKNVINIYLDDIFDLLIKNKKVNKYI